MAGSGPSVERWHEAVALLRQLRRLGSQIGVRHSGIAFDIGMLLYERQVIEGQPVSVDMLSAASGYSGPTVRLVLKRLVEAGAVEPARRLGKTQLYRLTAAGLRGFNGYVDAVLTFRDGAGAPEGAWPFKAADGTGSPPNPPSGRSRLQDRYADVRPGTEDPA